MFLHVVNARYLDEYRLLVRFNNGVEGIIDLEPELHGEVFLPLRDTELFRQVSVTSRTVEWPNGADFAPEFLYSLVRPNESSNVRMPEMLQPIGD